MSERWGDSKQDRAALDKWLTQDPRDLEDDDGHYWDSEPICMACGLGYEAHDLVQHTDADGNDYETYQCRQPATGSTLAKDNDPVFQKEVVMCKWFLLCENEAVGTVQHPVLGAVPVCQRCVDKLGLDLDK